MKKNIGTFATGALAVILMVPVSHVGHHNYYLSHIDQVVPSDPIFESTVIAASGSVPSRPFALGPQWVVSQALSDALPVIPRRLAAEAAYARPVHLGLSARPAFARLLGRRRRRRG